MLPQNAIFGQNLNAKSGVKLDFGSLESRPVDLRTISFTIKSTRNLEIFQITKVNFNMLNLEQCNTQFMCNEILSNKKLGLTS